jgi:hypothetical protein
MEKEVLGLWGAVYLAGALRQLELVEVLAEHTTDQEFISSSDYCGALRMSFIESGAGMAGHLGKYG